MPYTTSSKKILAFVGATGGCANAALALALKNGHLCSALARTPKKLTDMLEAAGVSTTTIADQLHIEQGDVQDVGAIKRVFTAHGGCDMIVSGLGAVFGSKNVDWQICQKGMRAYLQALEELRPAKRPHVVVISTTGISEGPRDVPIAEVPMYKVLLKVPHEDKKIMEQLLVDAAANSNAFVDAYTIVRSAFLLDREPKGMNSIRSGSIEKPAVGYAITRKDVGLWIFEELIKGDSNKYRNQKPTITN